MKIVLIALMLSVSYSVMGQHSSNLNQLVKNSSYALLVEIISKSKSLEWLGTNCEVWASVIKDYYGNYKRVGDTDSIPILIEGECIDGQFIGSNDLQYHKQYLVFLTCTSLSSVSSFYYRAAGADAICRRVGDHDRNGFMVGEAEVSHSEFMRAIASIKKLERIQKRLDISLSQHRATTATQFGFNRIWSGRYTNGVLADGIYWSHWTSDCCDDGNIFTYKNGRIEYLSNIDDNRVVRKVEVFLKRYKCDVMEIEECVNEVRGQLAKRRGQHE
jgi:hypothetical protein